MMDPRTTRRTVVEPDATRAAVRRAVVAAAILVVTAAGCSTYQIGNRSLYPAHIRTVYVPTFESNSFRRNLGERLTEAVVKEIELKTPYKVVATPDADSVLTGLIASEGKRVVAENRYDDPRQVEVRMQVMVNWIDRQGTAIRPDGAVPLPPSALSVTGTADVTAEVGQSVATSQQDAINRVAEQIVAMMEAPW
jgi:hypothetical protein